MATTQTGWGQRVQAITAVAVLALVGVWMDGGWPGFDRGASMAAALPAGARVVFEQNRGQAVDGSDVVARGRGLVLTLFPDRARFHVAVAGDATDRREATLEMTIVGGRTDRRPVTIDPQPGRTHYALGRDSSRWVMDVEQYGRAVQPGVYDGIDLVWYSRDGLLEHDWVVAPGADPSQIEVRYTGARRLVFLPDGGLRFETVAGDLTQRAPILYQERGGQRVPVAGRYVERGPMRIGIDVDAYDPARVLVIDPLIVFSTYLGGSSTDIARSVAVDSQQHAYVASQTNSPSVLGTVNPEGTGVNTLLTKFDPSGNVVFQTLIGGSSEDTPGGVAVDALDRVYVVGSTRSLDFPTSSGAFQRTLSGADLPFGAPVASMDAFLFRLRENGRPDYSSLLGGGGDEVGRAVAVDAFGRACVTGRTDSSAFFFSFPVRNAFQTLSAGVDAFVTVFTEDGSDLAYSTRYSGPGTDDGRGIAVDGSGFVHVTGVTDGAGVPTRGSHGVPPFQTTPGGSTDAFVARFNPNVVGTASLVAATLLGGSQADSGQGIAVDGLGRPHVAGTTQSPDFPLRSVPHTAVPDATQGSSEGFVTALPANLSALLFSTYLGGAASDTAVGIGLDDRGNAYVAGMTGSSDFPRIGVPPGPVPGGQNAFVTRVRAGGSAFDYSLLYGGSDHDQARGIAADAGGVVWVVGDTKSSNLPVLSAEQFTPSPNISSLSDGFVARINP